MSRQFSVVHHHASVDDEQFANLIDDVTREFETHGQVDEARLRRDHPKFAERLILLLPTIRAMAGWANYETKDNHCLFSTESDVSSKDATLGDYRIIKEIGRGGMGIVYLAEQISLCRQVALKILPLAAVLDPRHLQRFKSEVQAAALLQHQHIVPVYGVGKDRGIHYYSMQYVDGYTLADVIAELRIDANPVAGGSQQHAGDGGNNAALAEALTRNFRAAMPSGENSDVAAPLSKRETVAKGLLSTKKSDHGGIDFRIAARLAIQAADALDHAHSHGILHRDIKPANLMVDAKANLWIMDFGLARLESDAGMTMTGDLLGTLRYMSPEQALAKRVVVDHRSDIYSLGATLYELLTLRPVFSGADRQEVLKQIAFDEPRSLRNLDPTIPCELETITLKAMEKNPAARYETAQQLADDLRRYLDDRPIWAKPPNLMNRAAKWSRRHRGVLVATIGATLLAWATASLWIWRQHGEANQQRDRAKSYAELADNNINHAVSTIDQLLNRLENEPLLKREEMQPLREAFLEDVLRFNERMIENSRDYPEAALAIAEAYMRIATIQRSRRDFDKSFVAYGMASSLFERLAAKSPPDFLTPRARFAQSLHDHAIALIDRGKTDDVREALRLMERVAQQWEVSGQQADNSYDRTFAKLSLSNSMGSMAWAHSKLGNEDQAETSYREAIAILEDIPKDDWDQQPETRLRRDYLMAYASASSGLAGKLNDTGSSVEGEKWQRKAMEIQEQVAEYWPDNPERRLAPLGQAKLLFGLKLLGEGRNKEAAEVLRSSLENYSELVEHCPEIPLNRRMKAVAQYYLAHVMLPAGGSDKEAGQLCREAVETLDALVRQFPAEDGWRKDLFQAYRALGDQLAIRDPQAAATAYAKLIDVKRQHSEEEPGAARLQCDLSTALWRYGRFKLDQGDMEGARELMQRRVEIMGKVHARYPEDVDYFIIWTECLNDLARASTDLSAVRHHMNTALDNARSIPDDASGSHDEVGKWLLRYRYVEEAEPAELAFQKLLRHWRDELKKNPNDAGIMRRLSGIQTKTPFIHLADYDEALRCIQRVHEYSPGGKQIWLDYDNTLDYQNASDYGWALYRLERFDEAEEWFDQAECTKNPFAAFGRAMTKAKLGKGQEGRPYYELGVQYIKLYFLWDRPQYAVFREAATLYDDEQRLEKLAAERWVAK
jgi:serine/threonine protein kinase